MGRGFLAGISWGALVGVFMLVVSSFVLDRRELSVPDTVPTEVEVSEGSEFNRGGIDTNPVLPTPDNELASQGTTGVVAPDDAVEAPPALDTSSLEAPTPEIEAPSQLGEAPAVETTAPEAPTSVQDEAQETATAPLVEPEAPGDTPQADTEAPASAVVEVTESEQEIESPTEDSAPSVTTDLQQPATPTTDEVSVESEAPEAPVAEEDPETLEPEAPEVEVAEAPEATSEPEPEDTVEPRIADTPTNEEPVITTDPPAPTTAEVVRPDGEESQFFQPVDSLGSGGEGEGTALPTVRRIGSDETTAPEETETIESQPVDPNAPALQQFAADYEGTSVGTIISIILIDEEANLSDQALKRLPEFVAIGVKAGHADAKPAAAKYRASGREVVMVPTLPAGATPQDVEQALRVNFERVPNAVALMDPSGSSFQSDRAAVSQVIDVIAATGHGLITFPRGLNTAHQTAEKSGVPTGLIFRNLDANGEQSDQIQRSLDRAAFRARQNTGVVLVGSTNNATVGAIIEWAANNSGTVQIAPISAMLTGG